MKKLLALTLMLLLITSPIVTARAADEEVSSGGQVITGDNYEVTIPEDLRVWDLERWIEAGQNILDLADTYIKANPGEVDEIEAEIAELKEESAAKAESIEEKTGVDYQALKDAVVEKGKENKALYEKFHLELRFAMKLDVLNVSYSALEIWSSDLSKVEDVTSKYSAEEIQELNYIDFSNEEKTSFEDAVESTLIAYSTLPGFSEAELLSSEEVELPTNDNVELFKLTYKSPPILGDRNSRTIVAYTTVVSGNIFVMLYSETGETTEVEAAAESIFSTLNFIEVDRKDILGMEPDVFRKFVFIVAIAVAITILVISLVLNNKKKKVAAMQEQQSDFEGFQNGEQNSLETNQDQEMNEDQNQTTTDHIVEAAGQNLVAEETQLTDEARVSETEVTLESQEDEVKPTE